MGQTKYDVFISYSRKDYVDENNNVIPGNEVSKIIDALTEAGVSFWFDQEGIVHGEDFGEKILKYIKTSKIFVYLSTSAANDSEWTRKEIACAGMYKKKIIPVRIDDSPYHDSVMFRIADLDYVNYAANPKKGREELVNSIKRYMAEEKAAADRRAAEEQRRQEELERQHRQQEELRRKQQQADDLRAEISKTEDECTALEKALLLKKHDLDVVNLELDAKHKHLEEQKRQMTAILYDGSSEPEAKKSIVKLSTTIDEEIYSFQWRQPLDSLQAMWQILKETKRKRHWIVTVFVVLYVVSILGTCLWLLSETGIASIIIPFCTLAILTIYSLYQLLLNKRAGIGLILMTPIALGLIVFLFSTFNTEKYTRLLILMSLLSAFFVVLLLLIRKKGKSAMSLLTGKCIFAFHIHKYPLFYLLLVVFLFITELQVNYKMERDRGEYADLNNNYSQIAKEQNELKKIIETTYDGQGITLYKIGEFYYSEEQYKKAVKWYEIAGQAKGKIHVSKFVRLAQYKLGFCYEHGLGVQSDTAEALNWYHYSQEFYYTDHSYYDYRANYISYESGYVHDADSAYNCLRNK